MDSLFYQLIRVAIGNQDRLTRMPSNKEWKVVYEMAKKQSLIGVCFASLQKLGADADEGFARIGMSEMLYLTWMGIAAKIQQKNELVNQQCAELQTILSADGYRSYIMKGQSVANLYGPQLAALRQSGDIDVFIEGGLKKVLTCAEKFGGAIGVNELEMHVNIFEDTEVEFHYRPFIMRNPFKNRKLQAFFKSQEEACFANKIELWNTGSKITAPTMVFNLVHQMVHIHLHLFTEGVGLRQLMDFYMVLCNATNSRGQSVSEVKMLVHELGLDRFASALMWIVVSVFGLPKEQILWEPCEKDGKFLLDEILTSGNFGRYDKKQLERKGKIGYGLWALLIRNLRLSRFDRSDWFWGPLWRVYHFVWRKIIAK